MQPNPASYSDYLRLPWPLKQKDQWPLESTLWDNQVLDRVPLWGTQETWARIPCSWTLRNTTLRQEPLPAALNKVRDCDRQSKGRGRKVLGEKQHEFLRIQKGSIQEAREAEEPSQRQGHQLFAKPVWHPLFCSWKWLHRFLHAMQTANSHSLSSGISQKAGKRPVLQDEVTILSNSSVLQSYRKSYLSNRSAWPKLSLWIGF